MSLILAHVDVCISSCYSLLNSISLCGRAVFGLPAYLLLDIWIVYRFLAFRNKALINFFFFCGHTFSCLLGEFLGMGLLGGMASVPNFIRNWNLLSKVAVQNVLIHHTLPPAVHENSSCSTSLPTLVFSVLFILVILVGV